MSSSSSSHVRRTRPSTSTTRRILKVASLGIAGLIAGLLAGCSASSLHLFAFDRPAAEPTLTASRRVESLETKRIPAIRRAPVPHYTHPVPPNTRQAYALLGETGSEQTMAAARDQASQDNADFYEISEQ